MKNLFSGIICFILVASFAVSPIKASAVTTNASNDAQIQLLMQLLATLQAMLAELQRGNAGTSVGTGVFRENDEDVNTEKKPSITVWTSDSSVKFGSLYTVNWAATNIPKDTALAFSLIASDGTAYRIKDSVEPNTSGSFQWTMSGVGCWGTECKEDAMKIGDTYSVRVQMYTPTNSCYDNQWSNGACPDGMPMAKIVTEDRGLPFTVVQ